MNDEQFFLANAYLDGEVTDEERRIAEADPVVMAEVEQLRALQTEMRDVPAGTNEARESAIAAALAEFEAGSLPVGTADDPAATRAAIPLRPRPAYARYLGIAAAVVAVGLLGVVIVQLGGGGDDDDAAGFETAVQDAAGDDQLTESTAEDTADAAMADAAPADGGDAADDMAAADIADDGADEMAEEMAEEGDAGTDRVDSDEGDDAADDAGEAATVAPAPDVPSDFDPDAPIVDVADLAIYGAYLRQERDQGTLGSTPNSPCSGEYEALRRATIVGPDGRLVTVLVAIDDIDGTTLAIDEESCTVLLDTGTP